MIWTYVVADGAVLLKVNPNFTDLHGMSIESSSNLRNLGVI